MLQRIEVQNQIPKCSLFLSFLFPKITKGFESRSKGLPVDGTLIDFPEQAAICGRMFLQRGNMVGIFLPKRKLSIELEVKFFDSLTIFLFFPTLSLVPFFFINEFIIFWLFTLKLTKKKHYYLSQDGDK